MPSAECPCAVPNLHSLTWHPVLVPHVPGCGAEAEAWCGARLTPPRWFASPKPSLFAMLIWVLFSSYLISYISNSCMYEYVSYLHLFTATPPAKACSEGTEALTSPLVTVGFMQVRPSGPWKHFRPSAQVSAASVESLGF